MCPPYPQPHSLAEHASLAKERGLALTGRSYYRGQCPSALERRGDEFFQLAAGLFPLQ